MNLLFFTELWFSGCHLFFFGGGKTSCQMIGENITQLTAWFPYTFDFLEVPPWVQETEIWCWKHHSNDTPFPSFIFVLVKCFQTLIFGISPHVFGVKHGSNLRLQHLQRFFLYLWGLQSTRTRRNSQRLFLPPWFGSIPRCETMGIRINLSTIFFP